MIDYVSTEIVQYADTVDVLSLEVAGIVYEFYKSTFWDSVGLDNGYCFITDLNGRSLGFRFISHESSYDIRDTSSFSAYIQQYYDYLKPLPSYNLSYNKTILVLTVEYCGVSGGDGFVTSQRFFDIEESVDIFGTSGPYFRLFRYSPGGNLDYQYFAPVPAEFIPFNFVPPLIGSSYVDGDDIFFLYNFGRYLVSRSIDVGGLLFRGIGSANLLTYMFSTGFLIYATWCVLKWVIPV